MCGHTIFRIPRPSRLKSIRQGYMNFSLTAGGLRALVRRRALRAAQPQFAASGLGKSGVAGRRTAPAEEARAD
jgi:hypothetical protein